MTAVALPAQTFTTLYSFCSQTNCTDGFVPVAGLIQGTNGRFYGTTEYGGASNACWSGNHAVGCGTVFEITPNGALTTHSFNGADGAYPYAGLAEGTGGSFYGTTASGGAKDYGTIFKIARSGTLTPLHHFAGSDGYYPVAELVQGSDGNFYGTTEIGGTRGINGDNCSDGCGTIFRITPKGKLTTLYDFCSQNKCTDGAYPYAGLAKGSDGNFYGTTSFGGANGHFGTVFKITASGMLTTLHSFDGADGEAPAAGLVQATFLNGNFYGTTSGGGANSAGTLFKITPGGTLTTLYSFDRKDGEWPYAGLVQATDGNFYGTTAFGGADGGGTIFKITPSGALTTLYIFCSQTNCTDGEYPYATLVQGTNGTLFGTTEYGGAYDGGTVFSLSVGLGPFVETNPTSGKVGRAVKILGTNLTGSTAVTFNGTAATFTVKSKSEITTTVPTGATTGTVQVVTPGRTLSSSVPFTVIP
jgi:uncharacterized repeat protein (TIGR03803 family)